MPITDELLMTTAPAGNTTLGSSITLDGTVMTPAQVDDAFRELMAYRARAITRHVAKAAGSYSAAKADHNQFWRCTGAVTINLAAAATLTDGWCLWVRANGGAVTIDPNGAETIDGSATLILADGQTALITCTGTALLSVSGGFAGTATAQLDGLTLRGTAIASATTTDIGAATGRFVHITGTTTITGLGTRAAGVERKLVFDGALTLTHNATSLILPGAANINTAAGDVAMMVSEGAGNWRCVSYQRADGAALKPPTRQVFMSSGTWTKPAGLRSAIVTCIGGGGGGGFGNTAAAQGGSGCGGAAGAFAQSLKLAAALGATETVTIGAGGAGGVGATSTNPGSGGDTSLGTLVIAKGGPGGSRAVGAQDVAAGPAGGSAASSSGDIRMDGGSGGHAFVITSAIRVSGAGGNSALGGGPTGTGGGTGNSATPNTGCGGAGCSVGASSTGNGGAGGSGIVIVDEYY